MDEGELYRLKVIMLVLLLFSSWMMFLCWYADPVTHTRTRTHSTKYVELWKNSTFVALL